MSQLQISSTTGSYSLNVLNFSTPLYGMISGTQTKTMAVWFPIKVSQPEINFEVIFSSETDYQNFQNWVRTQQLAASQNVALLTLNWPERNINNWTGVISSFEAGGKRFNPAPKASFTVLLVDSLVSSRTEIASGYLFQGANWTSVYGVGSPSGVLAPATVGLNGVLNLAGSILAGT